jgi:3-hydroxyacyl-CoA dehydrogenase
MTRFGMPMGPLRLLDEVGLDVAGHAGRTMHEAFGARLEPAPPLVALEGADVLGRKGGRGFYLYENEKHTGVNDALLEVLGDALEPEREMPDDEIRDRLVLVMVNEAARVLEDGIVAGPGEVDLGMITGTGFPPFRGGLLRYADGRGLGEIVDGSRRCRRRTVRASSRRRCCASTPRPAADSTTDAAASTRRCAGRRRRDRHDRVSPPARPRRMVRAAAGAP